MGEGGVKNPEKLPTSFMDGPLLQSTPKTDFIKAGKNCIRFDQNLHSIGCKNQNSAHSVYGGIFPINKKVQFTKWGKSKLQILW